MQYPLTEIPRARFSTVLQMMYPVDWTHLGDGAVEYFAAPEPLGYSAEDEYMYYVRVGHMYYALSAAPHNIRNRIAPTVAAYADRVRDSI